MTNNRPPVVRSSEPCTDNSHAIVRTAASDARTGETGAAAARRALPIPGSDNRTAL